jgi:hypothetical protein
MRINQNERPTRQECERDESTQPAFIWSPNEAELRYWALTDPFAPENQR